MSVYNLQGLPLHFCEQEMMYLTRLCQRELLGPCAIIPETLHGPQTHRFLRAGRVLEGISPILPPLAGNLLKSVPGNHSSLLDYFWDRTYCFSKQPISHRAVNLHAVGTPSMLTRGNDLRQHLSPSLLPARLQASLWFSFKSLLI